MEGKINAIRYSRENHVPFLGICLGMQLLTNYSDINTCDKINEMSDEDPRLAELVKQAVTSKSCDSISPEHAELLVISQLCRPGIMTHSL